MFSVLSLNIKGLSSYHKQLSLQEYSIKNNSPVILLQETNISTDSTYIKPQYFHLLINPPVQLCSGVTIAIKEELFKHSTLIAHHKLVPGYLQAVNIIINQKEYHFINVYLPHKNEEATNVLNKIDQYITNTSTQSCVVLAGDWNLTLSQQDRRNCTEIRTQLVNQLKTLIESHDLADVWRLFNPNKNQFTFRGLQQNHPMARLDRFYLRNKDLHLVCKTQIIPSFSDHYGVTISFSTTTKPYRPAYWKLDPTILSCKPFQEIIISILQHYEEKSEQPDCNITKLWDKLKEEVQMAARRYTSTIKQQLQEKITTLEAQLSHIDNKNFTSPRDAEIALHIQKQISSLYKNSSSQKLQYFEAQIGNEANIQSKFFMRLAKQAKESAIINQLEVDGKIITDKQELYYQVQQAYSKSFDDSQLNPIDPSSPIYSSLSTITQEQSQQCDQIISMEEIEQSLQDAQLNRAPGMDGLPVEFYKTFWPKIKKMYHKVAIHFQQTGQLPNSMKKMAIIPIPKAGDRTKLKNWRPLSLMNTDYKLLSRIYSKRISSVVSSLLESDQSYCVPGKTIYRNLHKIRNIIHQANIENSPLGILALDQSAAFNNISHKYLIFLLQHQGFGPQLCKDITALLQNTYGYVKMGSTLLAPFIFKKGIRQGEPLAGPLYIISIEPFLKLIQRFGLRGFKIPRSQITTITTAFADDINFFITQDEDFPKINEAYNIYSAQSGASLNQEKSAGLFCGSWKLRNDSPFTTNWNNQGMKFLGVYLGNNENYEEKNWEQLLIKIKATLNKWSQYVKMTSYNGRKIIYNQLAGSQLIHTLTVLQPPISFIQEVNKTAVDFVWQGKHWLHPNFIYAPIEMGGLGLTNIEAKIASLRLTLVNDLQNNMASTEPGYLFHHHNMSLLNNVPYQHFFNQEIDPAATANLTKFYRSLLHSWNSLQPTPVPSTIPLSLLKTTPLYGSKFIQEEKLKITQDWKYQNIISINDLMNHDGQWKNITFNNLSAPQQRRLALNFNQIKQYFDRKFAEQEHIQDDKILYQLPQENNRVFPGTKKFHYLAALKPLTTKPQVNGETPWLGKKINWLSIQCYPIEKRDADITWRLLHNALVTPRKFFQWKIIPSPLCPWCQNQEGTAVHMFFKCSKVKQLWNFVTEKTKKISNLTELTYEQALLGFPPTDPSSRLSNFVLVLAKSTIYWSYMSVIKEANPHPPDYLSIFKRRIQHRLLLEENYAKIKNTQEFYSSTFNINNAFSS